MKRGVRDPSDPAFVLVRGTPLGYSGIRIVPVLVRPNPDLAVATQNRFSADRSEEIERIEIAQPAAVFGWSLVAVTPLLITKLIIPEIQPHAFWERSAFCDLLEERFAACLKHRPRMCFDAPCAPTGACVHGTRNPTIRRIGVHLGMHQVLTPIVSALGTHLGRSGRARYFSNSWHELEMGGHLTQRSPASAYSPGAKMFGEARSRQARTSMHRAR